MNKCIVDIKCLETACNNRQETLIKYICNNYDIKPTKSCFMNFIVSNSVLKNLINKLYDE